MSLNRRNFLKLGVVAGLIPPLSLLSSCSHQKFYNPDQDIVFGGGKFNQNNQLRHVIAVANIAQKETQLIDLNFLAHGIIIDPNDKNRLLTFEKNGANAAAVNLTTKTSIQHINTSADRQFNGHAVFDRTGETVFCTETFLNNGKGVISIRDGKNLSISDEFPSYGNNPHECQLIDDDMILLVTNTGSIKSNSPPCLTYIDVKSKKLIERVTLDNQQLNAGHFALTDDGSLIIASAPKATSTNPLPGGVSIRNKNQSILTMTQPEVVIKKLTGEALSIAIDNKHKVAAITHTDANMITFWSIENKQLIKAMSVPLPRGITLSLDKRWFIISYDINTSLVLVDTKDFSANSDSIIQPSYISGDHLYNWSATLRQIMPKSVYT